MNEKNSSKYDVYVGKFDQGIVNFLPEGGHYRQLIANHDVVICKNHPKTKGEKYISPGDRVVAVKWQSGLRGGLPFWRVFFYCSLPCQRSHQIAGNFSQNIRTG